MILSKTCNYGMRAVFYIAAQKDRKFVPIREISDELNISFHFLTKILQILTQANIMTSFRGPNGGVALTHEAEEIHLMQIISAIDGPDVFVNCLLGLDRCNDERPCPLHRKWAAIRQDLFDMFRNTTVAEVVDEVKDKGYRLTTLMNESG